MAKLTATAVVRHPETGEPEVLEAGSDVPTWAKDLIGEHLVEAPAKPAAKATEK